MAQQKIAEPPDRVEPAVGQIYEVEKRGDNYQILYVDDEIVLLRSDTTSRGSGNSHRIEKRSEFDNQIESGWFKYKPESNLDMLNFDQEDWSEVAQIGDKTAENLHQSGYKTTLDIQQADDEDLLSVGGVGNAGLSNLKEFVK